MQLWKNYFAAASLSLLCSPLMAGPVQDLNKKTVLDFYDLTFTQKKPTEAAKLYIGDKFIQHNPFVPNGAATFYTYFEDYFVKNPNFSVKVYRTLADEDLVTLHVHAKTDENDRGRAVVDIFRLENGKIVEHWDVIQAVPEFSANGNTMFDGDNAN